MYTKGDVFEHFKCLYDKEITHMSMDKRAQLGLGYLAQEPSIFTDLSVEDNLKLVLEFSGLDKETQENRLNELLTEFSINHIRKSNCSNCNWIVP